MTQPDGLHYPGIVVFGDVPMLTKRGQAEIKRFSFAYAGADPEELSDYYKQKFLPVVFKPLPNETHISNAHSHLTWRDWQIWSCESSSGMSITYRDVPNLDNYVLYLPKRGRIAVSMGKGNFSDSHEKYFIGNTNFIDRVDLEAGRAHLAFSFSRAAIVRQLSQMINDAVLEEVGFTEIFSVHGQNCSRLVEGLKLASPYLSDQESVLSSVFYQHLFDALTCLLLETVPNNFSNQMLRRTSPALPRHMKKAIDFMHEHAAKPISIAEVASVSGTTVRSLQMAFQHFRGITPLSYLRALRLKMARDLLAQSQISSVAEAALKSGFTHLGRFSASYYNAFGEYPSDTLKN